MAITRVTAEWSGFSGAPGYSNFYFAAFGAGDEVDLEVARVRALFNTLPTYLPAGVSVRVLQEAAILDESTGELLGYSQATTQPSQVTGTGIGSWSAASGAVLTWNTETIARGRRLRGRTFLVPLAVAAYDTSGTLAQAFMTAATNGASALIGDGTGPQAVIWSRPRGGAGGSAGPITSSRVADRVSVLRSRRD